MKKTLLFLLVCLTCNIMTGQGSLVMSPLDGTDNIVRFESTSGFHISCSQQGGDVHFLQWWQKNENNPNTPTSWSPLVFLNVIPMNRVESICTIICE